MKLKNACFWIYLMTIFALLFGCNKTDYPERGVFKQKEVRLLITEKNNTQQNYVVTLSTNGMEMENIATLPIIKTFIATNNKAEKLEIYLGQAYNLNVYRASVQSIDELRRNKLQTPSADYNNSEEKPLITYEFLGEEAVDIIELEIPSE